MKKMTAGAAGRAGAMITCPHCGASYEDGLANCPYCRSVDDYRDETEFMEDLEELRDKVEDLPEDVQKEHRLRYARETATDMGKILRGVFLAAAVIALLVFVSAVVVPGVTGTTSEDRRSDRREEYLWKTENFPVMDGYYEAKDWENLLSFADDADSPAIYDWEHYSVIIGLRKMRNLRDYEIPMADQALAQHGPDAKETLEAQAEVLRDELALLFWEYQTNDREDVEVVKEAAAVYLQDLEERFALTPDETEALREKARQGYGELMTSECKAFLENRES